jgi:release factor glutamine methyltransferase
MLHEKLATGRARLMSAGISQAEASIDVDLYARTILGWDRARLLAEQRAAEPAALEPKFSEWIARREKREPTAYIVGYREFWGLDFLVTPAVLVPRPESEFIVEEALAAVRNDHLDVSDYPSLRIADIGTGSGCLAISLAHEIPASTVIASDVSEVALEIARKNAVRHGVADRVTCVATSYLNGIDGPFDVIVANPPYVKDGAKPAISRDVRHEPEVALFGGPEGLRDVGGVLDAASAKLKSDGWLVMEFGYGQEDDVAQLVAARPALHFERVRNDLQGIARTAIIRHR